MFLVYFLIMELDPTQFFDEQFKLNYVFHATYVCIGCKPKSLSLKTDICKPDQTIKSKLAC